MAKNYNLYTWKIKSSENDIVGVNCVKTINKKSFNLNTLKCKMKNKKFQDLV